MTGEIQHERELFGTIIRVLGSRTRILLLLTNISCRRQPRRAAFPCELMESVAWLVDVSYQMQPFYEYLYTFCRGHDASEQRPAFLRYVVADRQG